MRFALLAALAVSAALPAGPAAAQASRTFGSWTATCDNVLRCTAVAPAADGGSGFLVVIQEPGPRGAPQVLYGFQAEDGLVTPADPVILQVDAQQVASTRQDLAENGAIVRLNGAQALSALQAFRRGSAAEVMAGRAAAVRVPLTGATAALLWIDERQGRTGESAPTPMPAIPVLRRAVVDQSGLPTTLPASLRSLPEVATCVEDTAMLDEASRLTAVVRLPDGGLLWGYACSAGAYNLSSSFWRTEADGGRPAPYAFRSAGGVADEAAADLTNAGFDPATGVMSAFAKARGLGDCGVEQRWLLTADGFRLIYEASMGDCVGLPPDLWARSYVAEAAE